MTDIAGTDKPLMFDQMAREHLITHYEKRLFLLRRTLLGISTNATHCGMCQMTNEICREAVERDSALAKQSP